MRIILFEDHAVTHLQPLTCARPAHAITCGSYRLFELVGRLGHPVVGKVRPYLSRHQSQEYGIASTDRIDDDTLWINARIVPHLQNLAKLETLVRLNRACVARQGTTLLAALVPRGITCAELEFGQYEDVYPSADLPERTVELDVFEYPHDVIRWNVACVHDNLVDRIRHGGYSQVEPGVWMADNVKWDDSLRFDTTNGPVVVDHGAQILPFVYLKGPVYIGNQVRINEHASIKNASVISANCKIGGEVDSSIFEPHANKQHYGFIGHSHIGSWVNLGGGTTNSNLKNTYGHVRMRYPIVNSGGAVETHSVDSEMTFVGCFVGDFSKTAINTSIFTGKSVGVCSMLYGVITADVPAFINEASSLGDQSSVSVDVVIATLKRVFARRGRPQTEADVQLIKDLHELYSPSQSELVVRPLSL